MEHPTTVKPNKFLFADGLAMLTSLIGLGDSIYLTVEHLAGRSVKCSITSGCSKVLASSYASIAGIPTAAIGAAAYFLAFSLATLAIFGYGWARTALTVLVAPMFLTTVWLLYLQTFVLEAFCQYCLLSTAMTLSLTAIVLLHTVKKKEEIANHAKSTKHAKSIE